METIEHCGCTVEYEGDQDTPAWSIQYCLKHSEQDVNKVTEVLAELLEVGDLRGDTNLPHPSDDPILWTVRMQEAWDEARKVLYQGPIGV